MRAPRNFRLPNPWFIPLSEGVQNAKVVLGAAGVPTANKAMYMPVVFPCDVILTAMFFIVASGAGATNYDLGLYNGDYSSIALKGSTGLASVNGTKTFTFTNPIRVQAGKRYYAAVCMDNTGPNVFRTTVNASIVNALSMGTLQETSAFPLPSTMTPVGNTAAYIPFIGFNTL